MKADAFPLLGLFGEKRRLEVPLFQRQYVWNQEQQWEPLWEDISRKFIESLEARADAPVHFLGAMVLDQKQTPTTHVEKRQVIDGQQRLTTLQIFLAAFRDFCTYEKCDELAAECDAYILNKGMMANPQVDQFKVWPTQLDRPQFRDVILCRSRAELEKGHPLVRRKYSRKYEPRPRMVEAYFFFYDEIMTFFKGADGEEPIRAATPLSDRLVTCFHALKNSIKVAIIDLDREDDAQVIFETLNARGEPLLPADLLRNYIFLRASRQNEAQEALYEEYWRRFDDPFWRHEIRQGRLSRPRSDLFMQHFLASRQGVDIPVKHLFVEYKFWVEHARPFSNIREELATLARQGDDFRRLIDSQKDDVLHPLAKFLEAFDISTVYPFLLFLLDRKIADDDWIAITTILQSYLLRRAVCGLTTKNYNRVFLQLTKALEATGTSAQDVRKYLSQFTGDSSEWPSDEMFSEAWIGRHVYQTMNNPKVVYILSRLNATYANAKTETIEISAPLTVEHVMPQQWTEHWPLTDGSTGISATELWLGDADETDPRVEPSRTRDRTLQTFGNLTILTQSLNSSISNSAWVEKKPALLAASLLPINLQLQKMETWDERSIETRGRELLGRAVALWPGPDLRTRPAAA